MKVLFRAVKAAINFTTNRNSHESNFWHDAIEFQSSIWCL